MSAPTALTRRLVVIDLDGDSAIVRAPYPARTIIKDLWYPLRRWDPERSAWIVGHGGIRTLIANLREAGYEIDLWRGGRMTTLKPTGCRRQP
jgi:hypothetical protein